MIDDDQMTGWLAVQEEDLQQSVGWMDVCFDGVVRYYSCRMTE